MESIIRKAILYFQPQKTITFHTPSTPLQMNSDDCAYFVAWFVELLVNKKKEQLLAYSQLSGTNTYFDITYIRERMQLSLAGCYSKDLLPLLPPLESEKTTLSYTQ